VTNTWARPSTTVFTRSFASRSFAGRARVLDAACGPGSASRYLLAQRPELQLLGIDLAGSELVRVGWRRVWKLSELALQTIDPFFLPLKSFYVVKLVQ